MKHTRSILLFGSLVLVTVVGCGAFSLRRAVREGEAALKDQNYEAAIRHLTRAVSRMPNDAMLQYNLATAHFYLGNFVPAEAALEQVLAGDPDNTDAVELQGYIALHRSQWDLARACFNHVLQAVPEAMPRLLTALSNVERGAMNIDLARVRLLQALRIDWKYAPAHYNLALLYRDHFELVDEAIDELELFRRMASSNDPHLAKAVKMLDALARLREAKLPAVEGSRDSAKAALLVKEGDRAGAVRAWSRAEKAYRDALAADPQNAAAAFGLGTALLDSRTGKVRALEAFNLAVTLNPSHADSYYQGALVALELKKLPEAARLLHRAAAQWPERDGFFALLITLRSAEGNLAGARAYGEYYLQIAPPGEQRSSYERWLKALP